MAVLYTSNFDADTVGNLPAGWTAKSGTWVVGTDRPVSGARSFGTTSGTDGDVAMYTGAAASADMGVQYDFTIDTLGRGFGAGVRFDSAYANGYLYLVYGVSGSLWYYKFKKVANAFTPIGDATNTGIAAANGAVVHVRATALGSTISLFLSVGANALPTTATTTFTDTSVTAAGYPLLYRANNTNPASAGTVDNFQYDDAAVVTPDTTAPTLTGTITSSAISSSGFTISYPAGSDNVAVTGYEYSLNAGSSFTDAGNVLTKAITGLSASTSYSVQVRAYDAAGNKSTPALAATITTSAAASNNALTNGTGNVLWSPYNWNVGASTAKTINPGAYFKTIFTGATCSLQFDMTGITNPKPQISYRIDGTGAWYSTEIAASVTLTMPAGTTDYASKGGHLLEVIVKSMTETQLRWSTQSTAVSLTGITLDTSATLTKPAALPMNCIFYGDSITEGVRTLNSTAPNDTDRNDAAQGWAFRAAQILGAEAGIVGFGASGFTTTGSGGVPVLSTSYNLLYAGVARSFAVAPDFIVLMEGTNDAGDVTSAATTVLNSLIAATPAMTEIIVLRPFNGTAHATQLINAIAACTTPSRCTYVDTAGWFTTANSSDSLHPYGNENINRIAPLAANAIRPHVQPLKGTRVARTVTLTLNDRAGAPRANLSGLKWSFFDSTTPGDMGVAAATGTTGTTNGSGILTLSVTTTLAPGGIGFLVISDTSGAAGSASNAFAAPVTVS